MRIGIASLAHVHAETYVKLLHGWDGVELVVADPDESAFEEGHRRTRDRVTALGVEILNSFDALFASKLDGVIICTANAHHRRLTERAALAGVNVLCEKPIATSREDAAAMVEACERAGVGLMLAYPTRFSPGMVELRRLVNEGTLGRILACDGANVARIPTADRSWFGTHELAGGGALMDHTVHLADVMMLILGAQPAKVYAQENRITHSEEVDVETGAIVTIEFSNGVVATIDASWSLPDSNPTWGGLSLRVIGETGEFSIDVFGEAVRGQTDVDSQPIWRSCGTDINRLMLVEFLASIREARAPIPDGRDGLRTLEIVLAAYASTVSGQPEAIQRIGIAAP